MAMNVGALPIDGIRARISSIESRFVPEQADPQTVTQSGRFDPFGETYQRALATRTSAPAMDAPQEVTAVRVRSSGLYGRGVDGTVTAAIHGRASTWAGRPAGGYGSMPVPPELEVYGNGRIPADALVPINQSGHRLYAPAAASWDNVVRAAAQDGFDMRITDSYRSYEQQIDLANRKGLYVNGGWAATPGKSNHGWGLAVDADLTDPALLAWMRVNGPKFGWVEPVPREPWHWEFRPHQV